MKAKYIFIAALAAVALSNTSCEKVSPQGVLMGNTAVEDRVEMSYRYFQENNLEQKFDYDLVDFSRSSTTIWWILPRTDIRSSLEPTVTSPPTWDV